MHSIQNKESNSIVPFQDHVKYKMDHPQKKVENCLNNSNMRGKIPSLQPMLKILSLNRKTIFLISFMSSGHVCLKRVSILHTKISLTNLLFCFLLTNQLIARTFTN